MCLADHPFPREFGHLQNSCPMGILGTSSNLILCSEVPCCLPLRSLWTDFDVFPTFPTAKFLCQYFKCSAPLKPLRSTPVCFSECSNINLPLLVKRSCMQSRDCWLARQATNSSTSLRFSIVSDASTPLDHLFASNKAADNCLAHRQSMSPSVTRP